MTAQIINLHPKTANKVCSCCGEEMHSENDWTEDWEPEEREGLEAMFIYELAGQDTDWCKCDNCNNRGELFEFQEGCCDCGELDNILYDLPMEAEDFISKWSIGWGWIFGADTTKPMGCIGNMPWGHFNTIENTLTYHNGTQHVTVNLPPSAEQLVNLDKFGLHIFAEAQKGNKGFTAS